MPPASVPAHLGESRGATWSRAALVSEGLVPIRRHTVFIEGNGGFRRDSVEGDLPVSLALAGPFPRAGPTGDSGCLKVVTVARSGEWPGEGSKVAGPPRSGGTALGTLGCLTIGVRSIGPSLSRRCETRPRPLQVFGSVRAKSDRGERTCCGGSWVSWETAHQWWRLVTVDDLGRPLGR